MTKAMTRVHGLTPAAALPGLLVLTSIASSRGDFNVSGGLDCDVSLAPTAGPAWK
jgi:hypothetical protein